MYGAILGDIVGSPYEFDCNNYKAKDFPLFSRRSDFTDDTVMTLAVVKALLSTRGQDDAAIKAALVHEMQQLGRAYPDWGYGTHFGGWLYEDAPQPYQSYGNGSAMRDKKIFPAAKTRSLPMKSFGRPCSIPQHTNHGTRRFPPSMRSTSFKTAKKQRGMCLNGTYPFLSATLVRQLPYYLFRETCFMDSYPRVTEFQENFKLDAFALASLFHYDMI